MRRSAVGVLITLAATGSLAGPAMASTRDVVRFHIPREPVQAALLDFALQARRSLGGDLGVCRGTSRAVDGVLSIDAALTRMLDGSGCGYVIRPDGGIFIRRAVVDRPAQPAAAAAPVAEPPEPTQLGEIVVTAGGRPEGPQGAPQAISAVSGERLPPSGATDLNSLSSLVAGMTVTNLGAGRNKILLRGMSDGAFTGLTQSTVALYLDLVPITYSAPDPDLKLVDIDRVEVIRGPQGTLYGTGPIGGVVRIITRAPDPSASYLGLSATNSLTHAGGSNTDYSGTANLALLGGRLAVRGSYYEEQFAGYINDVNLNIRRVNDGSRQGGRLAAAARLSDDWTVTVGGVHQVIDTEDTHYVYRILGGRLRANLVREPHHNAFDEAYATIAGRGDWGRLDGSVAYLRHRFRSRYDASTALPTFGSSARTGALDEAKDIRLLVAEVSAASTGGGPFHWLAGGMLSTSATQSDTLLAALRPVPARLYHEARSDDLGEFAVFGEASYDLSPALRVTAGARYYDFDYTTVSEVVQGAGQRLFNGRGHTAGISPKLAVAYRVSDDLNVYAQVSQGHRAGGFNTAGRLGLTFSGAVGVPSREYRPDSLWSYEAGAKATLLDGGVQARVALFVAQWDNIQSDQFLPSGLAYAVNVGDGANKGIEIELNWQATPDLEIRTNALFAHPEITHPSASFNSRGDAGLPGVPAASVNVNATYRRPVIWGMDFVADASAAYVGPSRLTFDAERRYRMGDYVTGRLSVGVEAAHWAATAFVDNPFDTRANTLSFGDPFRLPEALATIPLRPRTVGLTLSWRP